MNENIVHRRIAQLEQGHNEKIARLEAAHKEELVRLEAAHKEELENQRLHYESIIARLAKDKDAEGGQEV